MVTEMDILLMYMMDLVAMDAEIRDLGDEDILEAWLTHGLPDGAADVAQIGVLQSIAEDVEEYNRIRRVFEELVGDADGGLLRIIGSNWW